MIGVGGGQWLGGFDGRYTEVGSYPPNPWALHDMHNNIWEWAEDCWRESYEGAPSDGSAWLEKDGGDCSRRVLRGCSWGGGPGEPPIRQRRLGPHRQPAHQPRVPGCQDAPLKAELAP